MGHPPKKRLRFRAMAMRLPRVSHAVLQLVCALLFPDALSHAQNGPVGLLISPQNPFVTVGATTQFTATREVQHWLSSDATVVTVNSAGTATGLRPGVVTITAVSGIFRSSTTLTAVAAPSITNFISSATTVAAGQLATVTVTFSGGSGTVTSDQDASVLQVVSGTAVPVSPRVSTHYTLTVTNPAGSTATSFLTITVVPPPAISSFTPATSIVTNGNSTTLTAIFSGGTGLITPGNISVSSGTPVTVLSAVDNTTTYTLTVTGSSGSTVAAAAPVRSVAPPAFTGGSFTGGPSIVTSNASRMVTLTLPTFAGGAGVITNNVNSTTLPASSGGSVGVIVNVTTTFILTVTNAAGASISSAFTVTAVPPPTATSLIASAGTITSGAATNLTPVFSNGSGVINQGVGLVASGTPVPVSPGTTTTYSLIVSNAAGDIAVAPAATVTVIAVPSISGFTASPSTIVSGNPVQLTGTFSNGTAVITDNVGGPVITGVVSGTPVTVHPTANVIYTLTVTNAAGSTVIAYTYVDVD